MLSRTRAIGAAVTAIAMAIVPLALTAPASAAPKKKIIVWADEQRGPQLKSLIAGTTVVPGYQVEVKIYASLTALQGAWDKATAATGPDILTGPASFASAGGKSGKLAALTLPAQVRKGFSAESLNALSYKGKSYGIPLDVDTTAFLWNKKLVPNAPKTFGEMVDYYLANKSKLKGGFCAFEGTWGSQPVLTALGGGAWGFSKGKPNFNSVQLNSAAYKANVAKYLLGADGKSNGFFQWDGCADAFKAGEIPFANTGAWNFDGIAEAGVSFGIGAVPGVTAGTFGKQWVNYSGAYLTTYAAKHGVEPGARKLLLNYFASRDGQVLMSSASERPPAQLQAAAVVKNARTSGVAQAAKTGMAQVSPALDDKTGGSNWYDVLGAVYTDIFTKGADVNKTLDAAAAILAKNFAAAAKNL